MMPYCTKQSPLAVALILLSTTLMSGTAPAAEPHKIWNLATGSPAGVYYPIGLGIAEAAKAKDIEIHILPSEGSVQNIRWLEQGKAELCIAQSDTVYDAYNGLGGFEPATRDIRVISSLYAEMVHILIRKPLYVKRIEDMKGKRISIGPAGSGTESNARTILESSGISKAEYNPQNLSFEESIHALRRNTIDVAFITSGIPAKVVTELLESDQAYLFEPKSDALQRLVETCPFFTISNVPLGTYPRQNEEITTVGVSALLIARTDLPDDLLYDLTQSIFEGNHTIRKYHKRGADIQIQAALRGVAIPIKQGARVYYEEHGLLYKGIYTKIVNFLMAGFSLLALAVGVIKYRYLWRFFQTRQIIRVLVVLVVVWVIGSFLLYFAEHKLNDNYSHLFLSFWSGLINVINFGSKEPFSVTGRSVSTIMMLLWVGSLAWLTGEIASVFVISKLPGGRVKMDKIKDHYVIANWNDKAFGLIRQLHHQDLDFRRPIFVVCESKDPPVFPEDSEFEGVFIIRGDPANEVSLRRAKVHDAHSVVILSSESNGNITDARSILITLAIRKVCVEEKANQVPIIVEIYDPKNVNLATYAGVGGNGNVEVISSHHLGQRLLTQAAINPGISKIYDELMTYGIGDELYGCRIPSEFVGKSFEDLLMRILDLRREGVCLLPVGLSRAGKIIINPKLGEIDLIADGDILFAICPEENTLKRLSRKSIE